MPEYEYRCEHGHVSRIWTSIRDRPATVKCAACKATAEPMIAPTQRPIVRGGTPTHHGTVK